MGGLMGSAVVALSDGTARKGSGAKVVWRWGESTLGTASMGEWHTSQSVQLAAWWPGLVPPSVNPAQCGGAISAAPAVGSIVWAVSAYAPSPWIEAVSSPGATLGAMAVVVSWPARSC